MGNPQPPEDQASAVEEEIDEVVDPPEEDSDSGSDGEKPESHYSG